MSGARRSDGRPNRDQPSSPAQRSMSVVVRPTYEEDHLYGIDADQTILKGQTWGGQYTSSPLSMSPSLLMHLLKKRSPHSTFEVANTDVDDHTPGGDNHHIQNNGQSAIATIEKGRMTSFDSTSSLRSTSTASSSLRRSASEPDLRRGGDGDDDDDGNEDGESGKRRQVEHKTKISEGSSDDEITAHDLRADYVPIHASIDHTNSPPTNKTIVVVPSIDLDGDELKRVTTFIENYEERQLYHLLMLNDPGVRVIYTSSHPVSEAVVRYYVGLRGNGDNVTTPSIGDQLSRLYMLSPDDDSKRPLSKKLLARPLVLHLIKRLMESVEDGSLAHSSFSCLNSIDRSASFLSTAGLSVYTGSNACDNLAHSLGLRLLESCGETMHFGTKQGR